MENTNIKINTMYTREMTLLQKYYSGLLNKFIYFSYVRYIFLNVFSFPTLGPTTRRGAVPSVLRRH